MVFTLHSLPDRGVLCSPPLLILVEVLRRFGGGFEEISEDVFEA